MTIVGIGMRFLLFRFLSTAGYKCCTIAKGLILRQLSWSLSDRQRSDSNKVVEKENMVGQSPTVPRARVTV